MIFNISNWPFLLKLRNTLNWQQQCLDLTLEADYIQLNYILLPILHSVDHAEECPEAETTQFSSLVKIQKV